jgi:hypothetical protein
MHSHPYPDKPITYREVTVALSGGNDIALPANPKRVGLMLCADTTGGIVKWQLSPDGDANPAIGIGGATLCPTPLVLFGHMVFGPIQGPIRCRGTAGKTTVAAEWAYGY